MRVPRLKIANSSVARLKQPANQPQERDPPSGSHRGKTRPVRSLCRTLRTGAIGAAAPAIDQRQRLGLRAGRRTAPARILFPEFDRTPERVRCFVPRSPGPGGLCESGGGELEGSLFGALFGAPGWQAIAEQTLGRDSAVASGRLCRRDGGELLARIEALALRDETGALEGRCFFLPAEGEKKRIQRELKEKEPMAAIGTAAAMLAHEIRNPLNG